MSPRELVFGPPVLALLVAAIFGIMASREPLGSRRARLGFVARTLLGSAFLFYGLASILAIELSPRKTITGTITHFAQSHGRSSSSSFVVITDADEAVPLHTAYAGPNLKNGERLTATYVSAFGTVTKLELLGAVGVTWTLQEGDGIGGSTLVAVLGAALLYAAKKRLAAHPDGASPARKAVGRS